VNIMNIDYSDAFEKAVEEKQVALQKSIKEKNETARLREVAEQEVVKAEAEAKAVAEAVEEAKPDYKLTVDGVWGPLTTKTTQHILGVEEDGILGPITTKAIQAKVGATADGEWGPLTTKAMQTFLGVTVDGIKGPETIKAWQTWCNNNL
jgi:murein L,D-transpeptidase YcbB/YkuD